MTRRLLTARGFTLVEVMIAVIIGMLLIAGAFAVFTQQHRASVRNEDTLDLNSSTAISFNLFAQQIRASGYRIPNGTGVNPFSNFNSAGGTQAANFYPGNATNAPLWDGLMNHPTLGIRDGTDGLLLVGTDDNDCTMNENVVDNAPAPFVNDNTGTATAYLCAPNCFSRGPANGAAGYPPAATGSAQATDMIGLVTAPTSQTMGIFVKIISYQQDSTPGTMCGGNRTRIDYQNIDELNFWFRPPGPAPAPIVANQHFFRLPIAYFYYVTRNPTTPQLARLHLDTVFQPEIIADGVEDLQLRYQFSGACPAGWTNCDAPAIPTLADLRNLRFVNAALVARTLREDKTNFLNKGQALTVFDHTPPAFLDSYRRRQVAQLIPSLNAVMRDWGS